MKKGDLRSGQGSKRYFVIALALGAVGIIVAILLVRAIGSGREAIWFGWLALGVICPVLGVVYGPLMLTSYLRPSRGKVHHTAEGAHRFPFVLLGTVFGALGFHSCFIELASLHSESGFWTLFTNPLEAPELALLSRHSMGTWYNKHSDTPLELLVFSLAGGSVLGALGTYVSSDKYGTEAQAPIKSVRFVATSKKGASGRSAYAPMYRLLVEKPSMLRRLFRS
jgi:hypothetical protein